MMGVSTYAANLKRDVVATGQHKIPYLFGVAYINIILISHLAKMIRHYTPQLYDERSPTL